jgi:uncharacterized membrane protein
MITAVIKRHTDFFRITAALFLSFLIAVSVILIGAEKAHSRYYIFLIFNMVLGFLPVLFAWWLVERLKRKPWLSFGNIVLTLLWVGFLPNSFYMITDLIHAQSSIGIDLLYNIVFIFFCIFVSVVSGYISLYLVHVELYKRFYYKNVHLVIGFIILLCSFAIYLGRFLRWNSWDVLINPAGLLFDVTDSIASPSTHPDVFVTTITFFLLLSSMYIVIWQIARALRRSKQL